MDAEFKCGRTNSCVPNSRVLPENVRKNMQNWFGPPKCVRGSQLIPKGYQKEAYLLSAWERCVRYRNRICTQQGMTCRHDWEHCLELLHACIQSVKNHLASLSHPHSPNLAPNKYWLFADIKNMLRRKKIAANEDVIAATETYFESKDKSFKRKGIEKLKYRWNECITLEGKRVDKQRGISKNKNCFFLHIQWDRRLIEW